MSLQKLVAELVGVAKDVTSSLQATVTLQQWTGNGATGFIEPTYATAASYTALVELKNEVIRDTGSNVVEAMATITFLEPVTGNTATGRKNPIDPRDILTLPDGTTGPILDTEGLVNPDTNAPYFPIVKLGAGN